MALSAFIKEKCRENGGITEKVVGRRGRKKAKLVDDKDGENGVSKEEEVEGVGVNGGSVEESGDVISKSRLRLEIPSLCIRRVIWGSMEMKRTIKGRSVEEGVGGRRQRWRIRRKVLGKNEHKGNGQKDSKGVLAAKRGRKGRKKAEANGVGGLEFEKKENGGLDGEDEKSEGSEGPKMRMKRGHNKGVKNGTEDLKGGLLENEESLDQEKKKAGDLKEAHGNGGDSDNKQGKRHGLRARALKVLEQEKPKANRWDPTLLSLGITLCGYPHTPEEDIAESCPVCSGNRNCKACLRLDVPVKGLKNEKVNVTKEDKVEYSRYLLQGLLPFLKQLNEEHGD
ncbi:hypothetical protein TorRG33x02_007560 [Trema orientale]|uniref:Uncharacterized protein n=1 Tax=Trema orientale TaxID=63057 RepID=A0A2P5G0J9_TREOI|nr:hypothetical protein TorRG33x02_007560 [Trema orientale]